MPHKDTVLVSDLPNLSQADLNDLRLVAERSSNAAGIINSFLKLLTRQRSSMAKTPEFSDVRFDALIEKLEALRIEIEIQHDELSAHVRTQK